MNDPTASIDVMQFDAPDEGESSGWAAAEIQCLKFPDRYVQKCIELNEMLSGLTQVEQERAQLFEFIVRNLLDVVDGCEEALDALARQPAAKLVEDTSLESSPEKANITEQGTDSETGSSPVGETDTSGDLQRPNVEDLPQQETDNNNSPPAGDEHEDDGEPSATDSPPEAELADSAGNQSNDSTVVGDSTGTPIDHASASLASVHRVVLYLLEELGVQRVDLLGTTYETVTVSGQTIADPFEVIESTQGGKASQRVVTQVISDLWIDKHRRILRRGKVIC